MNIDTQELDYLFGEKSSGTTTRQRARTSKRMFVRSQDHLALDNPNATGRRLTPIEVLDIHGIEVMREVMDYGSAILPVSAHEPAATLKARREELGLSISNVAQSTALSEVEVKDCEDRSTRSPIQILEKIAIFLGLDERKLSVEPGALKAKIRTPENKKN